MGITWECYYPRMTIVSLNWTFFFSLCVKYGSQTSKPNLLQMKSPETYTRYSTNPYTVPKQTRTATIYNPDDYTLSVIMGLSPAALRVLMVMAARVNPDTGKAECTTKEIRDLLGGQECNISRGKTELVRADLIAYAEKKDTYFIKAFKTLRVTL